MNIRNVIQAYSKCMRFVGVFVFGSLISSAAQAASLDFNIAAPTPAAGSVFYDPSVASSLIGNNIEVDTVVGLDTASHAGVISLCSSCLLSFQTGSFTGYDANSQTWSFGSGGSISILGGVDFPDLAAASDIAAGSTLLSGSFDNAAVVQLSSGVFDFRIAGGSFNDTKNPVLLDYYGLPQNALYEGGFNISFQADSVAGGGFSSTSVVSGNILNTPVPLPPAAFLLLSALGIFPLLKRIIGRAEGLPATDAHSQGQYSPAV